MATEYSRKLAILLLAMLALNGCGDRSAQVVTIRNTSSKICTELSLEVCGQSHAKRELKPGDSWIIKYSMNGDCSYAVRARYADGNVLEKSNFGYTTYGAKFKDVILLEENGIVLVPRKPESVQLP